MASKPFQLILLSLVVPALVCLVCCTPNSTQTRAYEDRKELASNLVKQWQSGEFEQVVNSFYPELASFRAKDIEVAQSKYRQWVNNADESFSVIKSRLIEGNKRDVIVSELLLGEEASLISGLRSYTCEAYMLENSADRIVLVLAYSDEKVYLLNIPFALNDNQMPDLEKEVFGE